MVCIVRSWKDVKMCLYIKTVMKESTVRYQSNFKKKVEKKQENKTIKKQINKPTKDCWCQDFNSESHSGRIYFHKAFGNFVSVKRKSQTSVTVLKKSFFLNGGFKVCPQKLVKEKTQGVTLAVNWVFCKFIVDLPIEHLVMKLIHFTDVKYSGKRTVYSGKSLKHKKASP